jgi:hypothetical protein
VWCCVTAGHVPENLAVEVDVDGYVSLEPKGHCCRPLHDSLVSIRPVVVSFNLHWPSPSWCVT